MFDPKLIRTISAFTELYFKEIIYPRETCKVMSCFCVRCHSLKQLSLVASYLKSCYRHGDDHHGNCCHDDCWWVTKEITQEFVQNRKTTNWSVDTGQNFLYFGFIWLVIYVLAGHWYCRFCTNSTLPRCPRATGAPLIRYVPKAACSPVLNTQIPALKFSPFGQKVAADSTLFLCIGGETGALLYLTSELASETLYFSCLLQ